MIVGFVSDAHGNAAGLDRCLRALERQHVERVFFLGDSIGYMPNEVAVLERLKQCDAICLRGNHEEMLLGHLPFTEAQDTVYRIGEARSRIGSEWTSWIENWPLQRDLVIDGSRLLLVHGSPLEPATGYLYPDSDLSPLHDLPYDLVLCGHTHRSFIRKAGSLICVNTGSCGLPRDVGNLASCAVYDSATQTVEILRVEFDAQQLISTFGSRIHTTVVSCLQRTSATTPVGRLIDA